MHEQSKVFFKTEHKQIDISEYSISPSRYNMKFCGDHKEKPLIRACAVCHHVYCEACRPDESTCLKGEQYT